MSKTKKKIINITDPVWCELKESDGRFVLEIHSSNHLVRLHFERYWISTLAGRFWKMIQRETECIESIKKVLRGETVV